VEIIWSQAADRDVACVYAYLEPRSLEAARRFLRRLFDAVDTLAEIPRMGSPADLGLEHEYRYLVLDHYKIFYYVGDAKVVVSRVWDTRQDPTQFFVPRTSE
jgi:plasmid stabilization system protein ParE